MKALAALLLAVGLAAACVSAGLAPVSVATPTPSSPAAAPFLTPSPLETPPVDVPSGSCIFTLDVDNQTASEVTVAANAIPLGTVAPHNTRRFYEFTNGYPPLPWSVDITRTTDGAFLVTNDFPEGTESGRITVRDEPEAIAAGYCP